MKGLKKSLTDLSSRYHEAEIFEIHLNPADKPALMAEIVSEDSPLRGHDYIFDQVVPAGSANVHIKLQTIVGVKL